MFFGMCARIPFAGLTGNTLTLPNVSVADMVSLEGEWRWKAIEGLLPAAILLRIAVIECPLPYFLDDSMGWNATSSGRFSVSFAYRILHGVVEGPDEGTQRMKVFMACDIKLWVKLNLTQPHRFAIDTVAWDLMFGGIC
ncbi:hypothetical protein V6N13_029087 [Hibiscus sabdariffa]